MPVVVVHIIIFIIAKRRSAFLVYLHSCDIYIYSACIVIVLLNGRFGSKTKLSLLICFSALSTHSYQLSIFLYTVPAWGVGKGTFKKLYIK